MQFSTSGTTHRKGADGKYKEFATKGYGSTAATSFLGTHKATATADAAGGGRRVLHPRIAPGGARLWGEGRWQVNAAEVGVRSARGGV